ncbi:MAG: RNA polymerase factor sigma-54 [Planctomycetota bacterium]
MRLGLTQSLRTELRQVQSPQMIQAMQILQTPLLELKDQIEQEMQENVFLEVAEEQEQRRTDAEEGAEQVPSLEDRLQREYAEEIEQLEARLGTAGSARSSGPNWVAADEDPKLAALYNTPGPGVSLPEHLLGQIRMTNPPPELFRVVEHVIYSLDHDGRLEDTPEQIAEDLQVEVPLAHEAIAAVRKLEPIGMAARDLRDCLIMQLDHLGYVRPLTRRLVERHLDDLAMNRLPKIAKETGATIEEIKESWDFIRSHLNPHPGSEFDEPVNATVVPDVFVEEIDGHFQVRAERGSIPELAISPVYRNLLKEARHDPKIYEYLKKKIESAKWFIEAVHQRQSTIQRIASEVVRRQEGFLRHGVQHLKPMKMQDIADAVGVHISTVSRAISGKYIQTPQGIFDMKRFFSGGTVTDNGDVVSQRAVKDTLRKIVDREDKKNPYSDDQLVEELAKEGVHIARRTVTKYRKSLGIDSSSRRREF